jgi:hypothetical protein
MLINFSMLLDSHKHFVSETFTLPKVALILAVRLVVVVQLEHWPKGAGEDHRARQWRQPSAGVLVRFETPKVGQQVRFVRTVPGVLPVPVVPVARQLVRVVPVAPVV